MLAVQERKLLLEKTPILFYRGRTVVAGVKNLEELNRIAGGIKELLNKYLSPSIRVESIGIVNVTAREDLGLRTDLARASERLGGIYDPEYRPYLVAKVKGSTVIVTQNGKIVVLGARSIPDAARALNMLVEKLGLKD